MPKLSSMTDAEWEEHDAKVAKNAAQGHPPRLDMSLSLTAGNFPVRAIEAALKATNTEALERLNGHDFHSQNIVVLAGGVGCGKTVAATRWMIGRPGARFLRASTFAATSRYDQTARNAVYGGGALVLDDLGAEFNDTKGSFLIDLEELVDTFYGDRKPMIITTNLLGNAFVERYGQRVTSRLRECGAFIAINSPDLRKKAQP
jgi:DNA replication protein DnaC